MRGIIVAFGIIANDDIYQKAKRFMDSQVLKQGDVLSINGTDVYIKYITEDALVVSDGVTEQVIDKKDLKVKGYKNVR